MSPQAWTDSLVGPSGKRSARATTSATTISSARPSRATRQCVEVFERLKASGDVYLGKYAGWYCTNDETFWLESKLVDGRCPNPECGREVQWLSEDNWFFALSKYRDRLLAHYREIRLGAAGARLQRNARHARRRARRSVHLARQSGLGRPAAGRRRHVRLARRVAQLHHRARLWRRRRAFRTFWPANVQLVGKEIARFHTIIWPAVLWALGLPAPQRVFAHGWITIEGRRCPRAWAT
jgi:methionyl-tRNA synthetase